MKNVADQIATEYGLKKKDGKEIVDLLISALKDEIVETGECRISGFGTFKVKTRQARQGINPKTKEPISIPESKTIGFKPSKALKEEVQ